MTAGNKLTIGTCHKCNSSPVMITQVKILQNDLKFKTVPICLKCKSFWF